MSSWWQEDLSMHHRRPIAAPRDGTVVVGLFERPGRRALATLASFVDDLEDHPMPPGAPSWMLEADARRRLLRETDPTAFFEPLGDGDETLDLSRVGWRPVASGRARRS